MKRALAELVWWVTDRLILAMDWLWGAIPMDEDVWAYVGGFRLSEWAHRIRTEKNRG